MPKVEAFLALEAAVAHPLKGAWVKRAKPRLPQLQQAVAERRFDDAQDIAQTLDLSGIASAQRARLEELFVAALLFGAQQLVPLQQTALTTGALPLPSVFEPALDQLVTMIEVGVAAKVRERASQLVARAQAEAKSAQLTSVGKGAQLEVTQKSPLRKAAVDLATQLDDLVMGTGKGLIDVAGNLATSRLVSFGFLDQAQHTEVARYQISEVLDRRTCPVCETMHGKTFEVPYEHARLSTVLTTTDPKALEALAPWPAQSAASVAELRSLDPAELQRRGLGTPPYHPGCRGLPVKLGSVEPLVPVVPLPAQQVVEGAPATTSVKPPAPAAVFDHLDAAGQAALRARILEELADEAQGAALVALAEDDLATVERLLAGV